MDDDKTRVVRRSQPGSEDSDRTQTYPAEGAKPPALPPSEKTTLIGRPARPKSAGSDAGAGSEDPAAIDASLDPVVGWLVITKGPGRGNALRLGNGWNSIGRETSNRIQVDYGDTQISRFNHARILYDTRARKFTITLGDGLNPTYMRGEALLGPTELQSGDVLQMGDTDLLFVALCGPNFDWQNQT